MDGAGSGASRSVPSRSLGWASAVCLVAVGLGGCASTVPMKPAEDAANPACAGIVLRLPEIVADLPIRETNAQGTGAWGSPAQVLLRCGVPYAGPTDDVCVTFNDVDWTVDDSDPRWVEATTFGRDPITEVVIDAALEAPGRTLGDLADAVSSIDATDRCQ